MIALEPLSIDTLFSFFRVDCFNLVVAVVVVVVVAVVVVAVAVVVVVVVALVSVAHV